MTRCAASATSVRNDETAQIWQAGYFNNFDREFYRTFDRHMAAVLEAFKARAEPPIHARAGRLALQLALAAIESYEVGQQVRTTSNYSQEQT